MIGKKTQRAKVAGLLGVSLVQVKIEQFADTEINVELLESIRGRNVYVLQVPNTHFALVSSTFITCNARRVNFRHALVVGCHWLY